LSNADHAELLAFLKSLKGMVVLSGYPHPLYDDALKDWRREERIALADGAKERTEVLWINPLAVERAFRPTSSLTLSEPL
jgi:DNA adenine methylase